MCDGGPFEGFAPVIQGGNAGPHQDAKCYNYVVNFCKAKQWLWETKGPQMPHMNELGLAVFPAVSRRHIHLIWSPRGMPVAKEDEI